MFIWASNFEIFNNLFKKPAGFLIQEKSYWQSEYDYVNEDPFIVASKFIKSEKLAFANFNRHNIYETVMVGENIIPWSDRVALTDENDNTVQEMEQLLVVN